MDNSGVSPVKTAESTEMPFAGDSRGHALDGGSDSPTGLGTLGGHVLYTTPLEQWTRSVFARPDATSSTKRGRHAAAMRAVAAVTVATCYCWRYRYYKILSVEQSS